MEQYIIKGGHPLVGEVEIGGAKNAALAILAAAIMADETVKIDNLPDVNDINVLLDAITGIGADVQRVDLIRFESMAEGSEISVLNMIISRRSELPTICWEHCLENISMQKLHFREDVISAADRSISI